MLLTKLASTGNRAMGPSLGACIVSKLSKRANTVNLYMIGAATIHSHKYRARYVLNIEFAPLSQNKCNVGTPLVGKVS